ncbi:hypothetical protein [Mahella australiensis]|uniref:Uncharacterized protein n=1 Tax=Mahella australiensis (strain DSM 15567 / CIP 107919 / 50-1 BON) TaxID=697281 RepID=F3ZVD5_MAHA5|nr:hypothetical protein [Mahella australiensis]AEE95285.1 hypothetical protein Mahau_0062 [Mahella australiensis 50-1 BON]
MNDKRPISLEELKQLAQPDIIEISGFKPGETITIAVKMVDLTPYLLELNIGNPVIDNKGKTDTGIELQIKDIVPILDEVVKEAMVQPTYGEFVSITPMTFDQKLQIFNYAMGDLERLSSFRQE